MADTGFKVTGTVEAAGLWGNFTTTRLNTSDNSRTGLDDGEENSYGQCSDYTFGIPAGATINGIEVLIEARTTNTFFGGNSTMTCALSWNDGTSWTSNKTATVGQGDANYTLGGSADTWGRTWDDDEFANGTFRLRVSASAIPSLEILQIDYLAIKVYYTEAAGDKTISVSDQLTVSESKTISKI